MPGSDGGDWSATCWPAGHGWDNRGHGTPARCSDAQRGGSAGARGMGCRLRRADPRAVEAEAPGDVRPREALDGLRVFARGELRIGEVCALVVRAHAAAREVTDPAAVAAARAAGHAAGTAHMAAHARTAAEYAAKAAGLAAFDSPTAVADEARWQHERTTATVRDVLRRLPPIRLTTPRCRAW